MLKSVQVRTPEMVAEYKVATTEFPAYNMAQRIRHSTPQAPLSPVIIQMFQSQQLSRTRSLEA